MGATKIALLGGDRREVHMAQRLAEEGHQVALYAASPLDGSGLANSPTAEDAVRDAEWIICPSPGLGEGDVVYAPGSPTTVALDEGLLRASSAERGGLILGLATPTVAAAAESLGIPVFEMKADRSLAISNATSVAEAVVRILVESTERLLREHRVLVLGYGATGAAITDYLLDTCCEVTVAARSAEHRARAEQRGAAAVRYDEREAAFEANDIIINTAPDVGAVPEGSFADLGHRHVIDIASPPGGLDHAKAEELGARVTWARGLAGSRAPVSVGEAQLDFVRNAMSTRRTTAATP